MPIYEFECDNCDIIYECLILKQDDKVKKPCPKCKKMNGKIMSAANAHLPDSGTGWAKHGYSRKRSAADGPGDKSGRTITPVRAKIEPNKDDSIKKKSKLRVKK